MRRVHTGAAGGAHWRGDVHPPADRTDAINKFYNHPSPNPAKFALVREETGLPYEVLPVDTRKG